MPCPVPYATAYYNRCDTDKCGDVSIGFYTDFVIQARGSVSEAEYRWWWATSGRARWLTTRLTSHRAISTPNTQRYCDQIRYQGCIKAKNRLQYTSFPIACPHYYYYYYYYYYVKKKITSNAW